MRRLWLVVPSLSPRLSLLVRVVTLLRMTLCSLPRCQRDIQHSVRTSVPCSSSGSDAEGAVPLGPSHGQKGWGVAGSSSVVTFVGGDACLSYVPQFVAKSESLTCSIPRSFLVKSLSDFAAGLDDDLFLCPVWALRVYLDRTHPLTPVRHRLFVSPSRPSRTLSKNAVSFFLRDVITAAGAARPELGSVRTHDIRGVSTSVAFHRNWSVSAVLESDTWSSSSVFSSFYLRDIQHQYDGLRSLGPFVATGSRIE